MSHLVIVSGPSGVGKNTLIDRVREEMPELEYFRKITTRDRRPDDRGEEMDFVSSEEFDELMVRREIALPYELRGNRYGIPISSLAGLKEQPQICALGDFDLISALSRAYDTTNIYIRGSQSDIVGRLNQREDTPEQRAASIASVPKHLADRLEYEELFDYTIFNGSDLEKTHQDFLQAVKKGSGNWVKVYSFLIANGCSVGTAQAELDEESSNPEKAFPDNREMRKEMNEILGDALMTGKITPSNISWSYDNVAVQIDRSRDRDRRYVENGNIVLQGRRKNLDRVSAKLEERWPELGRYVDRYECIA
ncbi:MAG: hypothetical protein ABIE94_06135 [archaeon]